jgi:hypothetical protein
MWQTVYDPETGEIDYKKSDRVFPEHAVYWLIRGRERRRREAEERRAKETEAKAEQQ